MKTLTEYIISEAKVTTMQIMHEFVTSGKSMYDWTDKNDIIDFCFALTSFCEENEIEDELVNAIYKATGVNIKFRQLTTPHGWSNILSKYTDIKKLVEKVELIVVDISSFKEDERLLNEFLYEYVK